MHFQTVEQLQDVRLKTLQASFHLHHQCGATRVRQADIAALNFFLTHFFLFYFHMKQINSFQCRLCVWNIFCLLSWTLTVHSVNVDLKENIFFLLFWHFLKKHKDLSPLFIGNKIYKAIRTVIFLILLIFFFINSTIEYSKYTFFSCNFSYLLLILTNMYILKSQRLVVVLTRHH